MPNATIERVDPPMICLAQGAKGVAITGRHFLRFGQSASLVVRPSSGRCAAVAQWFGVAPDNNCATPRADVDDAALTAEASYHFLAENATQPNATIASVATQGRYAIETVDEKKVRARAVFFLKGARQCGGLVSRLGLCDL